MADPSVIQALDAIQGENYLSIQTAAAVLPFDRRPAGTVVVVREGEAVTVLLAESDKVDAAKCVGVKPGQKAELPAKDVAALVARLDQIPTTERIRVGSLLAIRIGQAEYLKNDPNLDLKNFKIEVVRDGDAVVVIFSDKDAPPGTRGINRQRPSFEVALKSTDRSVIRANYTR